MRSTFSRGFFLFYVIALLVLSPVAQTASLCVHNEQVAQKEMNAQHILLGASDYYNDSVIVFCDFLPKNVAIARLLNKFIIFPCVTIMYDQQYCGNRVDNLCYQDNDTVTLCSSFIYKEFPQKRPEDSYRL